MTQLNASASEAALAAGVQAATDVTGFGLLGHLHRMLAASAAAATLTAAAVPLLPGAQDLAAAGFVSGGTRASRLEPGGPFTRRMARPWLPRSRRRRRRSLAACVSRH